MRFTRDDVDRFASWSADRNPLHVDAEFARHTHFGQPIVHGILTVLGALQDTNVSASDVHGVQPKPDTTDHVRSLELEFRKAVLVDDEYSSHRSDAPNGFAVTLESGGDVVLTIRAETAPGERGGDADLSWSHAL